jgi:hypothetical protein
MQMKAWHVAGFFARHTFAASHTMRSSLLALAALTALANPPAASAQRVTAEIRIHHGPVVGHLILGHPGYARLPYNHEYTVVVYRTHRRPEWFRRHGFRTVRVWYDDERDRYYEAGHGPRGHLREVVLYERGGHSYRDDRRGPHDRD